MDCTRWYYTDITPRSITPWLSQALGLNSYHSWNGPQRSAANQIWKRNTQLGQAADTQPKVRTRVEPESNSFTGHGAIHTEKLSVLAWKMKSKYSVPHKVHSFQWMHFTVTKNDASITTCKLCSAEISRSSSLPENFSMTWLSTFNYRNFIFYFSFITNIHSCKYIIKTFIFVLFKSNKLNHNLALLILSK